MQLYVGPAAVLSMISCHDSQALACNEIDLVVEKTAPAAIVEADSKLLVL